MAHNSRYNGFVNGSCPVRGFVPAIEALTDRDRQQGKSLDISSPQCCAGDELDIASDFFVYKAAPLRRATVQGHGQREVSPMSSSIVSPTPIECQTDAAAALRAARADARAARARQCRAQAWSIMFFVDACDDEAQVAAWLAERAALIEEAERLEGGAA